MTSIATTAQPEHVPGGRHPRGRLRALRGPVICGAVVGVIQAASPLGFWWLEPPFCATVDWVVAGILAGALLTGVSFHG